MNSQASITCNDYGDSAVLVTINNDDYEIRWLTSQSLGNALRIKSSQGIVDVVASFQSVFVSFDPEITSHSQIMTLIQNELQAELVPLPSRLFKVPVVYGDEFGPHINQVSDICGISPDEVIDIHAGQDWVVRFVGSPVGAPLMDGPKFPTSIPRLTTPVARMNPGSVAVSGLQSIIYNAPSPGGWQVIGRTPVTLFDLVAKPNVPYLAGDRIRFVPILSSEWDLWDKKFHEVQV